MKDYQFLARFVNTVSVDDSRYPAASKLFQEVCVEARIRRQAESESRDNQYMPPIPKFKVKRLSLSEAVETAMRFDVLRFAMSFAP